MRVRNVFEIHFYTYTCKYIYKAKKGSAKTRSNRILYRNMKIEKEDWEDVSARTGEIGLK